MNKSVLVSVGTTEFQKLIMETSSPSFIRVLQSYHYTDITYQIGRGKYIPEGKHFRYDSNIYQIFKKADLIICHGGAGTLIQCLEMGKKVIAVVNDTLSGNHQKQIVSKLSSENYLLGILSADDLNRDDFSQIHQYLSKENNLRTYKTQCRCILNQLVFGQKNQ